MTGERRPGRGRLSSIDQLPPEADPDIQWAVAELLARQRSQADILFELNDRLAVIGAGPISSSAFNRYSVRKAAALRRLQETRDVAAAVTERLGPDRADAITVTLVEMIKAATLSILESGDVSAKDVLSLARALAAAMAAQKQSGAQRRVLEAETRKALDDAAEVAADAIAAKEPRLDPADVLALIRAAYTGGGAT